MRAPIGDAQVREPAENRDQLRDLRTPPMALNSERAVVGTILTAPGVLKQLSDFDPSDMLDPFMSDAVTVALDLREPFDAVLIAEHLDDRGHPESLRRLHDIICDCAWSPGVLHRHLDMITAAAHRRRVIEYAAYLIDAAYDDTDLAAPLSKLLAEADR